MAKEVIQTKGNDKGTNFETLGKNKGKDKIVGKCNRLSFFKFSKLYLLN